MSKVVTIPKDRDPFVVIVNGVKYSYPAGESVSVPDAVADVIERYEGAKPKPDPDAGKDECSGGGASTWEDLGSTYKENERLFIGAGGPLTYVEVSTGMQLPMFPLGTGFDLVEGKEYTVEVKSDADPEGLSYPGCKCYRIQIGGATGLSIGNVAAVGIPIADNGLPFVVGVFDDPEVMGVPAAFVPLDGITELTFLAILGDVEKITPVPPKYLPGGFGSVVEEGVVLDECSPALADTSDGMNMFAFTEAFPLVEGHVYTVHWNDKLYTCVCSHMNAGSPGLGLGNIGALVGDIDTGEPFIMGVFDDPEAVGFPAMAIALDGSDEVTVSITGVISETITPLPRKYMPDLGAEVVVVFIDTEFTQIGSGSATISISHTNDEIAEAHKKGKFVVLMTGTRNSGTNSRDFYMPSSITSSQARFTRIDFYTKDIREVIIQNDNATKQSYSLTAT